MELSGSITTLPGEIDGWGIQEPNSDQPESGAFRVTGVDGYLTWRAPREAASGRVEEGITDTPRVLAHNIQHGCTIVWFAKSSTGNIDSRIGAVAQYTGIEIIMGSCRWTMQLNGSNLTIVRTNGTDTLDISVMVVKL